MKRHQLQNDESMFKGASPQVFRNAEKLRNEMTPAEICLWKELKQKKFKGLKFRRQHPIQSFIADFYCHSCKLIIELDGEYHQTDSQIEKDKERTEILTFNDVHVLRFTNNEVFENIDEVLKEISDFIENH